jgi:hypothetical protein
MPPDATCLSPKWSQEKVVTVEYMLVIFVCVCVCGTGL